MLINEIPDDCLLAIFEYLVNTDDLINCYKVCVKWSHLIAKRAKKVKYFGVVGYSSDYVYYPGSRRIDSTCLSKLFTNLQIASLSLGLHRKVEDAIEFVRKQKSLRGLIKRYRGPIERYCDRLEMLSVDNFNPNNLRNGSSLKQLNVEKYSLKSLERDVHYLPNLERLKMCTKVPDNRYDGPVLEKLKILELAFHRTCDNIFYGFQLMDLCPNLQSAHIFMAANAYFFDETLKHKCLQDLVIEFAGYHNHNWNNLKSLLLKYPNLKHLSLRIGSIKDEHIEELVHILPNLVLLDVGKCSEVTQRAADYVKDYCKKYGRSIKFYFKGNRDEIGSDWPIKYEIVRGFDFMKHCFFKWHGLLSKFLIPI
ncbi:uncharacterized protein LOC107369753 isoform X14 [Tetranychus urticae]|uniref:F-box domain-containing protein n=1 Tax=Tetranychus urticae TaxID=32264 RepID=T1L2S2_TETUR|nr:uncharacterized protein LOC107369753 isoform X14 [Tetranychus urticae]